MKKFALCRRHRPTGKGRAVVQLLPLSPLAMVGLVSYFELDGEIEFSRSFASGAMPCNLHRGQPGRGRHSDMPC